MNEVIYKGQVSPAYILELITRDQAAKGITVLGGALRMGPTGEAEEFNLSVWFDAAIGSPATAQSEPEPVEPKAKPRKKREATPFDQLPPSMQDRLRKANEAKAAKRALAAQQATAANQNGHNQQEIVAETVEVVAAPEDPFPALG